MTQNKAKKRGRIGEVRCLGCFERFWPEPGADQATCPACGRQWYVSWKGNLAKIRKPVWESWEQQQAEAKHTER
jgi:rRNA maturation endonuclease Nob1